MRVLDIFFSLTAFSCDISLQQYQPLQSQAQQRYSHQGNPQRGFHAQQKQQLQLNQQQHRALPQQNSYQQPVAPIKQYIQQNSRFQPIQQQHLLGSSPILLNTPTKLDDHVQSTNGAQVQIRLTSYQNPTMALSNTTTCNCPIAYCDFLPLNQQNACSFSFLTIISSTHQSAQYMQSDFNPFHGSISTGNWTNPHTFQMISKPVSIDIFVQHLGVSIDRMTANLLFFAKLILVDTFVVDLSKFKIGGGEQFLSLVGLQLGTQLQLSLNIQCINGMMGEMCDLSCTIQPTSTIDKRVICQRNQTGDHFNCSYNSYTSQVSECELCLTNGYFNGTCVTSVSVQYIGVSSAFRVWTIILGCLLGLAILLILCLIISYIIVRKQENREKHFKCNTPKKYTGIKTHRSLLDDQEWSRSLIKPAATRFEESFVRDGVTHSNTRQEHQV